MRRHQTHYTLPVALVDALDNATGAGESRSRVVDLAIHRANKDPHRLVQALSRRLVHPLPLGEMKRIGLSSDDATYEKLISASEKVRLPVEHVLRLAIEALIAERAVSLCAPEHIECD